MAIGNARFMESANRQKRRDSQVKVIASSYGTAPETQLHLCLDAELVCRNAGCIRRLIAMASFGRRVDGPGGRRRIKRKTVSIHGSAATMDGSRCILIEDLSLMGARVRGRGLPKPGSEVLLRSGDRAVVGRVAWESGDRRGLLFNGARR
jgi:hypothetical protein